MQRQEDEEKQIQTKPFAVQISQLIQRQSISIQRKCAACTSGKGTCPKCAEEERLQHKPIVPTRRPSIHRQDDDREDELLQGKSTSSYAPTVSPRVAANINAMRGGGQPLSPSVRAFFEPRFGVDFSGVRVHRNSRAAEATRNVHVKAFTVRRDVMFGSGQFAPETSAGKKLLAHELTHVVQQGAAMQRPPASAHRRTRAFANERRNAPHMMRAPLDEPRSENKRFAVSLVKTPEPKIVRTKQAVQLTVYFGQNISSLNYESFRQVEQFAKELRDSDNEMILVDSFASTEGTEEHNLELSRRRREEVIAILNSKLSKKIQFSGKAHGEKGAAVEESGSPSSQELENQRAQNRRVQIRIYRRKSEGRARDFSRLIPPEELLEEFAKPPEARKKISCGSVETTSHYDFLPRPLQAVVRASVGQEFCRNERNAAACYEFMDPKIRGALISIYQRLCEFGLWHHVRAIEKSAAGEKPVDLGLWNLEVPGLAENIHSIAYDTHALFLDLLNDVRFCIDAGIGGSLHAGQASIRQVKRGRVSLHLALGPGNKFDAHIDQFSPVEKRLKGGICPEVVTIGTLSHWGCEIIPEMLRSMYVAKKEPKSETDKIWQFLKTQTLKALTAAVIYAADSYFGGPLHSRINFTNWMLINQLRIPGFRLFCPDRPSQVHREKIPGPFVSQRDRPPAVMFDITLFQDWLGGGISSDKFRRRFKELVPQKTIEGIREALHRLEKAASDEEKSKAAKELQEKLRQAAQEIVGKEAEPEVIDLEMKSLLAEARRAPGEKQSRPLPPKDETALEAKSRIMAIVKERIPFDALAPQDVKQRLKRARDRLADVRLKGPLAKEEEVRKAEQELETARAMADNTNPAVVADFLTNLMWNAYRAGESTIEFELGPQYAGVRGKQAIADAIKRIALIIRKHLPGHAESVHSVILYFGNKGGRYGRGADESVRISLTSEETQRVPTFDAAFERIDEKIRKHVAVDALVPAEERSRLRLAERRLRYAGPEEEESARAGLRDAKRRIGRYENPRMLVGLLALRMQDAHKQGQAVVELELGPHYRGIKWKNVIANVIKKTALIVRGELPEQTASVRTVRVYFGKKLGESGKRADEKIDISLKPIRVKSPEKKASAESEASEFLELLRRNQFLLGP